MPPKPKAPKLHVLAAEIPAGFKFADTNRKEFVLGKQFATGGFGRIYTCTETGKKEQLCVKVEPSGNGPLFVEIAVFQRALKLDLLQAYCREHKLKSIGLPHMVSGGIFDYKEDKMRFLIMPKYAGSLEGVREKTGRLEEAAALTVAKAIVRSLDYLASKNYTHGDIKAANILLPAPSDYAGAVLVDFGLARMASSNVEKADKKRAHNGTAIFTSLDAHRGFQPSYRGDIEILVYNIVYWLSGKLPWLPKEANPAAVQTEKEAWEKGAEREIEKLVGPALATPIAKIYRLAQKTPYTEYADSAAVLKLLDQALAACGKPAAAAASKKKSESTPKVESAKPSTSSKRSAAPKKAAVREEDSDVEEEEEEELIPKSTSRRRKPVIESSEESADEPTPKPLKRATVPKRAASELRDSAASAASASSSASVTREERMRKRTASAEPSPADSPTRKPSASKQRRPLVIPGLANGRRAAVPKKIVEESEGEEEDEKQSNGGEEEAAEEGPKGVGSAVKASKEELRRMVPGMRNIQKGRRSEIISEIARKHKK